jgi:large subunit ribosomal protein L3
MKILGVKKQMTRIYEGDKLVPVTLIDVSGNVIAKVSEGRVWLGRGEMKKAGKQKQGMYSELGYVPKAITTFKAGEDEYKVGDSIDAEVLEEKEVQVSSYSKGKGFAGGVKRWGWAGGPATHGYSRERRQGSIGSQRPAKVWKGKHMPGHMGNSRVTIKGMKVLKRDGDVIAVKGSVPGASGSLIEITLKE